MFRPLIRRTFFKSKAAAIVLRNISRCAGSKHSSKRSQSPVKASGKYGIFGSVKKKCLVESWGINSQLTSLLVQLSFTTWDGDYNYYETLTERLDLTPNCVFD